MDIEGWRYYNHAAVPACAPHEMPDLTPIKKGTVWRIRGGIPLLARWTVDWDCGYETGWWYVIKDTPFDINAMKSKRRYEVNKGNKFFEIIKINPVQYADDLLRLTIAAYSGWPEKYRPRVDREQFLKGVGGWGAKDVFVAMNKETRRADGYALLSDQGPYIEFSVLRTDPSVERLAVNAAIISGILNYYQNRFDGIFYISDGSRSIRHETAFQDYLEKYFGFRKAYCRLRVVYRPGFRLPVICLRHLKDILKKWDGIGAIHQINAVLRMDELAEICRKDML